jgi:Fe2+ or Zn2+ uptake regulation protein
MEDSKIAFKPSILTEDSIPCFKVICSKCADIIDITLDLSSLCEQAKSETNYKLNNSSIVFTGTCPKCDQNLNLKCNF